MKKSFLVAAVFLSSLNVAVPQCGSYTLQCTQCVTGYYMEPSVFGWESQIADAANAWNIAMNGQVDLTASISGYIGTIDTKDIDAINCSKYTGHPAETFWSVSNGYITGIQTYINVVLHSGRQPALPALANWTSSPL